MLVIIPVMNVGLSMSVQQLVRTGGNVVNMQETHTARLVICDTVVSVTPRTETILDAHTTARALKLRGVVSLPIHTPPANERGCPAVPHRMAMLSDVGALSQLFQCLKDF